MVVRTRGTCDRTSFGISHGPTVAHRGSRSSTSIALDVHLTAQPSTSSSPSVSHTMRAHTGIAASALVTVAAGGHRQTVDNRLPSGPRRRRCSEHGRPLDVSIRCGRLARIDVTVFRSTVAAGARSTTFARPSWRRAGLRTRGSTAVRCGRPRPRVEGASAHGRPPP